MTAGDAIRWAGRVRSERPPAAPVECLARFEDSFNGCAGRAGFWRARDPSVGKRPLARLSFRG